jgi:hypothetical protein
MLTNLPDCVARYITSGIPLAPTRESTIDTRLHHIHDFPLDSHHSDGAYPSYPVPRSKFVTRVISYEYQVAIVVRAR